MSETELLTLSEISRRLMLAASTVSNWRSRYQNFPKASKIDGKRERWTIDQITDFMVSNQLEGRDRNNQSQTANQIDYTIASNLIAVLKPIYTPENAVCYLILKMWDSCSNSPSHSITELANRAKASKFASPLIENILHKSSRENTDIIHKVNDHLDRIVKDRKTRLRFVDELELLWASSGRDRAAMTSPEILNRLIAKLAKGNMIVDLCAGIGGTTSRLKPSTKIYAQDINPIAAAFLFLINSIKNLDIEINLEDSLKTLHRDWLNKFDCVIALPPSRSQDFETDDQGSDPRWMKFGKIRLQSHEAWILNALAYSKPQGESLLGLPTKWMTAASSADFRNRLVGLGHIKAAISLGTGFVNDNRVEMSILVLSPLGDPNRKVRLVDARNLGTSVNADRQLNDADIDLIQTLLSASEDYFGLDLGGKIQLEVVEPEELLAASCPLELNAFRANKSIKIGNPTRIQKNLNKALIDLAASLEGKAAELRDLAKTDEDLRFGEEHPKIKLQNLAEISIFSQNRNETWPAFEIKQHDIFISIIRQVFNLSVISDQLRDAWDRGATWQNFYDGRLVALTRVCRIRVKTDSPISANALAIFLNTKLVVNRLDQVASTSTKRVVPGEVIRNLLIPCPPAPVQEKIIELHDTTSSLSDDFYYDDIGFEESDSLVSSLIEGMIFQGKI